MNIRELCALADTYGIILNMGEIDHILRHVNDPLCTVATETEIVQKILEEIRVSASRHAPS